MDDIKITKIAAEKIKKAAVESQTDKLPLRIAVSKNPDGSFHYGMGFDDVGNKEGEDLMFASHEVNIVVAKSSFDLLKGTTLDYAELEPKQFHFIFLNPNDPSYSPTTD